MDLSILRVIVVAPPRAPIDHTPSIGGSPSLPRPSAAVSSNGLGCAFRAAGLSSTRLRSEGGRLERDVPSASGVD